MSRVEQAIVVVGGGPAGLSTALFLAHRRPAWRDRIVVLEKAHYPREKYCAGGLGARADAKLAAIGVTVDTPSARVDGLSVQTRYGTSAGRPGAIGRVVRRIQFDQELAEQARAKGIHVCEGARVTAVHRNEHGATVETSEGALDACAVVGADGVGSIVRKELGLPVGRIRAQVIECDTPRVAGDPAPELLHFDLRDRSLRGYGWDFPTIVDGELAMCRGIYQLRDEDGDGDAPEQDVRDLFAARLAGQGLDIEAFRLKRFAERGFDWDGPISAPRVLLVGEAAGIDGITGEGIAQGVEYGIAASEYLVERIEGGRLAFEDWRARVTSRIVGIDLAVRRWGIDFCYGRARPFVERWLTDSPWLTEMCLARFKGGYPPAGTVARAFAGAIPAATGTIAERFRSRPRLARAPELGLPAEGATAASDEQVQDAP